MKFLSLTIPFLIFFSVCNLMFSQSTMKERDELYAREQAKLLSRGTLIVRVFTNGQKVRQLRDFINSSEVPEKTKTKLRKTLAETQKDNDEYFDNLKNAMSSQYTFSKVLYMPDTLYKTFESGNDHVFWNEEQKVDNLITIDRNNYFVMICGNNPEKLLLVNRYLKIIDKPFPHKIQIFLHAFKRMFNSRKYMENQVKGFQDKLALLAL
ncbi:MAG: hypothetical protein IPM42_11780 [Saprospiraceae bacterium]|nr:hypothetical protein [Saprospiraceae bacterium]